MTCRALAVEGLALIVLDGTDAKTSKGRQTPSRKGTETFSHSLQKVGFQAVACLEVHRGSVDVSPIRQKQAYSSQNNKSKVNTSVQVV